MKYVVQPVVWLLFSLFPLLANNKVDFSSDWLFDKSASTLAKGGDRFAPVRLKIEQLDSLMIIQHTCQREYENDFIDMLTFSLDGKENYSEFWHSPRIITAEWSDDQKQLIINTKIIFAGENQENEIFSTDVWRLGENGAKVRRDLTFDGP